MTRSPGLIEHKWIITSPFSSVTWIFIILSLYCLTLFLLLLSKYKRFNTLISIHCDLTCILLNQNIEKDYKEQSSGSNNTPTRLVLAFWILSALILSNAYSSAFYSILMVPVFGKPINSIDDLLEIVKSDSKLIVMNGRSIYWYDLVNSKADNYVYYTLGKHLNRYALKQIINEFCEINNLKMLYQDQIKNAKKNRRNTNAGEECRLGCHRQ